MPLHETEIKSVAIIGAGAAGAITAAAFKKEGYFDRIAVFERRESAVAHAPHRYRIYDASPKWNLPLKPGVLPLELDPPLLVPNGLPITTPPNHQERFSQTPVYESLTTNVPDIAMSFSDIPFAYGPFVPHHIPRQYIESYFSAHKTDNDLQLNTTVEDISKESFGPHSKQEKWKLTIRKYDNARHVDIWWAEEFDAVVLANGHYSIPFIPEVDGLADYIKIFPGRVSHSKTYRSPHFYANKKVLVIGNSASGHDLSTELVSSVSLPLYQSRRSASRWDGDVPPSGISWVPVIKKCLPSGRIVFSDDSHLDDLDYIIYCTGYLPSFPFWNKSNGRPLWNYSKGRLVGSYQHTFFRDFKNLAIVGLPRVLTFRSFEYQAIALARLWSGRNWENLPDAAEMERWESEREIVKRSQGKKFHDIEWDTGETMEWLGYLYRIAGLGKLTGEGRTPPMLGEEVRWALEHLRKYPEPSKNDAKGPEDAENDNEWVVIKAREWKDMLAFL